MSGSGRAYRALLAAFALMAVGAILVGSIGLYTVLTGGMTDSTPSVDVLGEYECADGEFAGNPDIGHDSSYEVERTVLSGTEVNSFDARPLKDGYRLEFTMAGELLEASAAREDGTLLATEVANESRVVVKTETYAPVQVWIDTVTADATVTRTRLAVCPPP